MSRISIIVPVYYNSDTLMDLYDDMKAKVLDRIGDYEIVFVDDGSGDDSCWKKGNEIVLAARRTRKDNPFYVLFANMYYRMIRKMVNKNMPIGGCDCYLVGRKAINELIKLNEKNSSLTLQVMWLGFQTDIVYFDRQEREKGKGRWTMGKKVKLVMDSILSFSYAPLRLMMYAGFLFDLFALIIFICVLVEYFTVGTPIAGWSSLMCVVLLGFGMMMTMTGLIGEYIWRALDASRNRPPFIIDVVKEGRDLEDHDR